MKVRFTPVTAIAAIVIAGVAGGTAVYLTGSEIAETDRAAILAWESSVERMLASAHSRVAELPRAADRAGEGSVRQDLLRIRQALQDARNGLPEVPTPRILYPPTESFTVWFARAFGALAIVEQADLEDRPLTAGERDRVDALLADAATLYDEGRDALIRLRCRARIPDCAVVSLPP